MHWLIVVCVLLGGLGGGGGDKTLNEGSNRRCAPRRWGGPVLCVCCSHPCDDIAPPAVRLIHRPAGDEVSEGEMVVLLENDGWIGRGRPPDGAIAAIGEVRSVGGVPGHGSGKRAVGARTGAIGVG